MVELRSTKTGLATLWAIFSQTHLVTLPASKKTKAPAKVSSELPLIN
jgi:hypothetical protein